MLFQTSKQNISLHVNNIFKEGELDRNSVVKESLTTAYDGKKYKTKFYFNPNLKFLIKWIECATLYSTTGRTERPK